MSSDSQSTVESVSPLVTQRCHAGKEPFEEDDMVEVLLGSARSVPIKVRGSVNS